MEKNGGMEMNILNEMLLTELIQVQSNLTPSVSSALEHNLYAAFGCHKECSGSCDGSCKGSCSDSCHGGCAGTFY
jgi:hypothetical protein